MLQEKKQAFKDLMAKTRELRTSEDFQLSLANIKVGLLSIGGKNAFVESRIKAPLSAYEKLDKEYSHWSEIKDLLGFMIVVDTNDEVDAIAQLLEANSLVDKNPNAKHILKDYRAIDIANEKAGKTPVYHPTRNFDGVERDYYITDGYKNVKANVLFQGVPTEIQIKTKAQYVAHEATHDPTYKSKNLPDDEKRNFSDRLFPYFEACAYLRINKDSLSPEQIAQTRQDINEIYDRNNQYYKRYPDVYKDACRQYAITLFSILHKDEFASQILSDDAHASKLIKSVELKRIFNETYQETRLQNPHSSANQVLISTINSFLDMSFEDYQTRLQDLKPETKLESCTITGPFDLIRQGDINMLNALSLNFNKVQVGIYDDELFDCIVGHPPMFSQEERIKTVKSFVQVENAFNVSSYDSKPQEEILPITASTEPRKYALGYLPGVFDMLHPGHREYIEQASSMCDRIVVGLKSDDYVRTVKNKEPIIDQEERFSVMGSLRTISEVVMTDNDITPPDEILNNPDLSVIFLGSDWTQHPEKKSEKSREELRNLQENYGNIELFSIEREKGGPSSSALRKSGLQSAQDDNPVFEVST